MDVFIASTPTAGLTPLGPANQRSLVLLGDVLRERLSPAHAALFADPVPGEFGDRFDWYAPQGGKPIPFARLSDTERATLRAELETRCAEIAALGSALKASADIQEKAIGEALANAVEIPSEDAIYALRSAADGALSPILINWGWVRKEEREVRGVLSARASRLVASAPAGGTAAAAVAVRALPGAVPVAAAAPWALLPWLLVLGWTLLGLLLACMLWLLVYPCGLFPGRIAYFCPAPVVVSADPLAAERLVLEDQIAALEREIAAQEGMCRPLTPALAPLPPPIPAPASAREQPPAPDDLDARLQDRGGRLGDLNFALFWDSVDDLDIHVTCPSGGRVYYGARSACGGRLDVDANVGANGLTDPVENIVFSNPASGRYEVRVHLFANRTQGPKRFTLRVRHGDGTYRDYTGEVSLSAPNWRQTITVEN